MVIFNSYVKLPEGKYSHDQGLTLLTLFEVSPHWVPLKLPVHPRVTEWPMTTRALRLRSRQLLSAADCCPLLLGLSQVPGIHHAIQDKPKKHHGAVRIIYLATSPKILLPERIAPIWMYK